jgi:predicted restriction endonuclease
MTKTTSTIVFQEMKPEDVLKAIKGHENILKSALAEHEKYFKYLSCIRCGEGVYAFVDPVQLFRSEAILPNYLARCKVCGTEFEPYTKIEIKGPSPPKGI